MVRKTGLASADDCVPRGRRGERPHMPALSPAAGRDPDDSTVEEGDEGGRLKAWTFLAFAEISNFVDLRRRLGRVRADRLWRDVGDVIAGHVGAVRVTWAGRRLTEFSFQSDERSDLEAALGCLRIAFEQPLDLDGEPHRLELAFAAAAAPTATVDDVRLLEEAESAITEARAEHRIVVRDLSTGTPAFDRLSLMRDLGPAIPREEMFLQYQPKVHLRRNEIASAEALVRWQHPSRGLILPGGFIEIAEQSRDIGALTLWTIRKVIADQRLIARSGRDMPIFVNISGQLLGDPVFVEQACRLVRDSGAKIGFEITETSVIRDPATAIRHLGAFAAIGIDVAIDDYGAGLSSLAYLKQLPARELKIDKMFVLQLTSSNRDPLIVRSTIDLAHAMEMEVTAEGVESQAALALLSVMGCDMVQGFLISRPLAIDAFRQFVEDEQHLFEAFDPRAAFQRTAGFWKGR